MDVMYGIVGRMSHKLESKNWKLFTKFKVNKFLKGPSSLLRVINQHLSDMKYCNYTSL